MNPKQPLTLDSIIEGMTAEQLPDSLTELANPESTAAQFAQAVRRVMGQPIRLLTIPGLEEIAAEEARLFPDTEGFSATADPDDDGGALAQKAAELSRQHRYQEMQELRIQLWRQRLSTLGPNAAETAVALNAVALGYYRQDQFVQARRVYEEVVRLRTRIFGKDHQETAMAMAGLGQALEGATRYTEAMMIHRQAVAILEATLTDRHPDTADSFVDLGCTLHALGRLDEAREYLERALTVRIDVFGLDDPLTAQAQANLGSVLAAQGNFVEARPLLLAATDVFQEQLAASDPVIAWVLTQLGAAHLLAQEFEQAFYCFQQAQREPLQPTYADHLQQLSLQINMGAALAGLGESSLAAAERQKGFQAAETYFGEGYPLLQQLRTAAVERSHQEAPAASLPRCLAATIDQRTFLFVVAMIS